MMPTGYTAAIADGITYWKVRVGHPTIGVKTLKMDGTALSMKTKECAMDLPDDGCGDTRKFSVPFSRVKNMRVVRAPASGSTPAVIMLHIVMDTDIYDVLSNSSDDEADVDWTASVEAWKQHARAACAASIAGTSCAASGASS